MHEGGNDWRVDVRESRAYHEAADGSTRLAVTRPSRVVCHVKLSDRRLGIWP